MMYEFSAVMYCYFLSVSSGINLSKKHKRGKNKMQVTHFGILGLGTSELIIILIIILLLFGSTQLPKLARSLGQSAKELRNGMKDVKGESKTADEKAKE